MATTDPQRTRITRQTPASASESVGSTANDTAKPPHLVEVLGVSRPIRVSGHRDERLSAIAERQRGIATRSQMRAAGLTDDAIDWLRKTGRLHPLHRAVYAVGHTAPTPLAAETAAVLACGPGAVLSHLSAAMLWELVSADREDGLIHVTIRSRHTRDLRGVCVHRTARLHRSATRIHKGLPITSPARTLLDAAELLTQNDLEWAVDEAITQRLVKVDELGRLAQSARGRRGAARLRAAVARHTGPRVTRSRAEKLLHELIRAGRLPEPQTNVRVLGWLVDAYWPAHRLAVEVDGLKFHRTRPKLERDSAKTAALVAAGIALMRLTWPQMTDSPFVVVAQIAQALARAEARWEDAPAICNT